MRFLWMEVKPGKMETIKPADDRDGILDIQSNFTNEIIEQMRYDRENCTPDCRGQNSPKFTR